MIARAKMYMEKLVDGINPFNCEFIKGNFV